MLTLRRKRTVAEQQIAEARAMPALNLEFSKLWELFGNGQRLEAEFPMLPDRHFRADFAHVATKTAVELVGGVHQAHRDKWERDLERGNALALAGWRVVQISAAVLHRDPVGAVKLVIAMLEAERG